MSELPASLKDAAWLREGALARLLDVLGRDGEEARVVGGAVRNALLPLVTLSAIQFGFVMGGVITIETIFSWPGLGLLEFQAINSKDFPMLQGAFLVFSVSVIVLNLIADCLYFVLDPRVQTA